MSTQKTVNIEIAIGDLIELKNDKYNLCFAKKVGDSFNVVWQSMNGQQYLPNNKIWWLPEFQIFGSNSFSSGVKVDERTNAVDIRLGQQATLDRNGVMQVAVTGSQPDSIGLVNDFGVIHPALSQLVSGPHGQVPTPIYVAENGVVSGTALLTPKDEVMVWFEQRIETSTMFSQARSNSYVVDLTKLNTVDLQYSGGQWSEVSQAPASAVGLDPTILTLVFIVGTGATISGALIATKIATFFTGIYSKLKVQWNFFGNQLTLTFSETAGLSPGVRSSPGIRDMLVSFTSQVLAAEGVDFSMINGY